MVLFNYEKRKKNNNFRGTFANIELKIIVLNSIFAMEEYKGTRNKRDFVDSDDDNKEEDVYDLYKSVCNSIDDLESSWPERNFEISQTALSFLTNKLNISDEISIKSPFRYILRSSLSERFLSGDIFTLFMNYAGDSTPDCATYALKLMIYMTLENENQYDNLIYTESFLALLGNLMKSDFPKIREYSRTIIANTMDNNLEACMQFIDDFLVPDPSLYKVTSLYIYKIYDVLPEDFDYQLLVTQTIEFVSSSNKDTMLHGFNIMLKAFKRKNEAFKINCDENEWWRLYVSQLLENPLSKYKSLGYRLMAEVVGFSKNISKEPLVPTEIIIRDMKIYLNNDSNGSHIKFLMEFLKAYVEVYGLYVNELFVQKSEDDEDTVFNLALSILGHAEYYIAESTSLLLVEVICKLSLTNMQQVTHGQVISGFLQFLENCSQDDVIARVLFAMRRLFKALNEINGHEEIVYDYDANNGHEILESLLESDDENVASRAQSLLSDIYPEDSSA